MARKSAVAKLLMHPEGKVQPTFLFAAYGLDFYLFILLASFMQITIFD